MACQLIFIPLDVAKVAIFLLFNNATFVQISAITRRIRLVCSKMHDTEK